MLTMFYSPHATSTDNETGRASGHADVPLSARGQKEALALRQSYAQEKLAAVFCSDLQRASDTAHIVCSGREILPVQDARLREYDYGTMTQYPRVQVERELEQRIQEPFPAGESLQMVMQRVGAFLCEILNEYDGKTVVIIGHRATRYGLHCWCSDTSLEEIVRAPWEWRDPPIWRYELKKEDFERRTI